MTSLTFEEELLEITAAYWQDMLEVTSDKEAIMLYERMADPLSKLKDRASTEHDNLNI